MTLFALGQDVALSVIVLCSVAAGAWENEQVAGRNLNVVTGAWCLTNTMLLGAKLTVWGVSRISEGLPEFRP